MRFRHIWLDVVSALDRYRFWIAGAVYVVTLSVH
jgi:hypothetical protein